MISIKHLYEPKGPWQTLKTMAETEMTCRDSQVTEIREMDLV